MLVAPRDVAQVRGMSVAKKKNHPSWEPAVSGFLAARVFGDASDLSQPGMRPPTPELPPERRMLCTKKTPKPPKNQKCGGRCQGGGFGRDALSPEVASCWEGLGRVLQVVMVAP